MVLTNKQIEDSIAEIVGEDVLPVVRFLKNRKNISEFKIAEKVELEVNQTRNMLYRLHQYNLVTYNRKKDRVKGWYISYWTLNQKCIKSLIINTAKDKLAALKEKLIKEEANKGSFFLCPNICVRLDFDKATDFDYKCPECGSLLSQQDNTKTIENLKKKIKEMESKGKKKPAASKK